MSPARRIQLIRLRDWVITPAAALTAALFVVGWVDTRYVHTATYRAQVTIDSLAALERQRADSIWKVSIATKLDSANLRLQQITCGRRVAEGCR
jgi:hypothetical protein